MSGMSFSMVPQAELGKDAVPRRGAGGRSRWAPNRSGTGAAAEALAIQADDLTVFAAFADLEDTFESVEATVLELARDVEGEPGCSTTSYTASDRRLR
jgi:hypothetical protein